MKTQTPSQVVAYLAYVCGQAKIREMGSDRILYRFSGQSTYDVALARARVIAKRNGWELR